MKLIVPTSTRDDCTRIVDKTDRNENVEALGPRRLNHASNVVLTSYVGEDIVNADILYVNFLNKEARWQRWEDYLPGLKASLCQSGEYKLAMLRNWQH